MNSKKNKQVTREDTLILQPTDVAQWKALLNEAQVYCAHVLAEELESYLVFMLMRFTKNADFAKSVLAFEMIDSLSAGGKLRCDKLRDVGDKCLLYAGLFPGRAQKKLVSPSYFVNMGKIAYGTLSNSASEKSSELFAALSEDFILLMDVLQSIRSVSNDNLLQPLTAVELWQETQSKAAKRSVESTTDSQLIIPNGDQQKKH